MILTDNKGVIQKVALLTNWETLGYVNKLEKRGFFDLWNGKTLKDAKAVKIDGYTGATCTATAVSKNVDFLLNTGSKKLPKN
jgi:Na+-translocating ferredoxin:NAD+ oxidoreductase RnfG subunit